MANLKQARHAVKIDDFIAEHEADQPGDMDKLGAANKRPFVGTANSDQAAAKTGSGND